MSANDEKYIKEIVDTPSYESSSNIAFPKGADVNKIIKGNTTNSVINKLHLIKLADDFPAMESEIATHRDKFKVLSFTDLCKMDTKSMGYDVDDFLYCKNLGFPINRLITLRRFPYPCTDNIWDKESQGEPDMSRMITYFSQDTNKLDEILSFSYNMKWKELTAEMEQATMQGEQTGLSGFMKKAMMAFDKPLYTNVLRGDNSKMLDPKYDQNKVYGPVDSITNTNIRDVGFEFSKEFELSFEYELRSINGRTPEYAMKDIIGNILACTYNNGKFWPGARYWIGDRPSMFYQNYQWMNGTNPKAMMDHMTSMLSDGTKSLKSAIHGFGSGKGGSAIDALKSAMTGGMAIALGKILDKVGRPGILTMNSLLSGEPTGFWHLTIGNPTNPIMCIGNLICTGVDFSFPSDSLSYGDFPTKMKAVIKLKPGQAKDRAGIEMMFNMGKHRIYYAPKTIHNDKNLGNLSRTARHFYSSDKNNIDNMLSQAFDFITDGVKSVTTTSVDLVKKYNTGGTSDSPSSANTDKTKNYANSDIVSKHG